ncbi:TPA: hypothetical protein ACPEZ2_002492 [Pseudomonas aeruginosa]
MTESKICTCPSGDGSLRWPCPAHPAVDQADVAAKLTFINGRPAMCGCQVEYSDGGGEYSDVIYVTLCAKHSGSAILDLVATNRIALTPEYEGQWHADLYLDREIPLAKVEGATPAEAVLALMSAERIDPEQESVEQASGDERAAFELFVRKHCGMPAHIAVNWDAKFTNDAWAGWQARAALAQPSPAHAEQEEAERPEVVAYFDRNYPSTGDAFIWSNYEGSPYEPVMTVAQHERIVGSLRAERDGAIKLLGQSVWQKIERLTQERDAALARVAEMEGQEPVAYRIEARDERGIVRRDCLSRTPFNEGLPDARRWAGNFTVTSTPLYAAPVAQAQQLHDLDKQCRDDVARALGLRPNQERGFAWSYLLASIKSCVKASEDSAQAQHSVPDGYALVPVEPLLNMMSDKDHDTRITAERQLLSILAAAPGNSAQHSVPEEFSFEYRHPNGESHTVTVSRDQVISEMSDFLFEALCSKFCNCEPVGETNVVECSCDEYAEEFKLLAAAPGKEVPQAWLDVQAERRRQVEAEGWTPEHDDEHSHSQMARAAACYALAGSSAPNDGTAALLVSLAWPWDQQWWKPTSARRDLVKACALALAEIERLDRAGISQSPQPGATTASS